MQISSLSRQKKPFLHHGKAARTALRFFQRADRFPCSGRRSRRRKKGQLGPAALDPWDLSFTSARASPQERAPNVSPELQPLRVLGAGLAPRPLREEAAPETPKCARAGNGPLHKALLAF